LPGQTKISATRRDQKWRSQKQNALGSFPGDTRHFTNAPTFSQHKRYLLRIETHTLGVPENALNFSAQVEFCNRNIATMNWAF
jgi:hypothetical protein